MWRVCSVSIPGHALHEKGLQRQKKRRSTVRQPGTKRASCPADEPLINPWSTADLVPLSVYIRFRISMLLERRCGDVFSMPLRKRLTFVSLANNSVGTKSCPIPPGRSARRFDPTCPWYVQVLDSTGRTSLLGAYWEMFWRPIVGALECAR